MTLEERRAFAKELISSVSDEVDIMLKNVPDHWTGHMLRAFISDWFASQAFFGMMDPKRQEEYRESALVEWWMPPSRR